MKEKLELLRAKAAEELEKITKSEELESFRVRYLGKKGELTGILKQMGGLSAEERPVIGQLANSVREELEARLSEARRNIERKAQALRLESEKLDVTVPGEKPKTGRQHPMYQVLDEIKEIFIGMGSRSLKGRR